MFNYNKGRKSMSRTSVELDRDLSQELSIFSVVNNIAKKDLVDLAVKYALDNPKPVFNIDVKK